MKIKNKFKRCIKCDDLSEVIKIKEFTGKYPSIDLYLQCKHSHYSRANFSPDEKVVKVELTKNEFQKFLNDEMTFYGAEFITA